FMHSSLSSGKKMTERIRGVLAPVVTPFKADLSPDSQRFIAHCKWLLSQNCGLAVFGTNSEANSLSMEERATLLDELVAAGVDPLRMMPGTGCCSLMETVKLTTQAVRDRYETISKSQTPSSKSQGRSKIQHPKGERALDVRRSSDADADGSFDVFVGSESFLLANMRNGGAGTISATANINPAAI